MTQSGIIALEGNSGIHVGALVASATQYLFWTEGANTVLDVTGFLTSAQALTNPASVP
ncbi:MAG: hypothetical protein WDN28_13120 [Chthoniobacter sp.]